MHGVAVFFVISGYLITTLLLREWSRSGAISLTRFYFRRTMRIFPPYYVYLAVMGLLWAAHRVSMDWNSLLAAISYTWALDPHASAPILLHTWSLSIEELFYLVWPAVLIRLIRPAKLLSWTLGAIFIFPFLRVLLYFIAPWLRGHEFYMVHGWADTILFGCLLAVLRQREAFERWHAQHLKGWIVLLLAFMAFYVSPFLIATLPKRPAGFYVLFCNPTLVAFASTAGVLYCMTRTQTLLARFLNNPILRHIGVLSYSLYLWQQIFMSEATNVGWMGYVYAVGVAEISFWLIERPSLKLRSRWEPRLFKKRRTSELATPEVVQVRR